MLTKLCVAVCRWAQGIASVSEPPVETQHHPKWTNIHTNIRKHMFNPQPWHLPTDTASSAPAPIQRMLPKFKVVEYCPDVFHNLRKIFNVNTLAYRASLGTLDWNNIEKNLRPAPHAHDPEFKLVGQAGISTSLRALHQKALS